MKLLTATFAIFILCLALASCQRTLSESERNISDTRATHPWQLPSGAGAYMGEQTSLSQPDIPPGGVPERVLARGPQFREEDTIDSDLLPGTWILAAVVSNEQMDLRSRDHYSRLIVQQNGMFNATVHNDGEISSNFDGTWQKSAPGVITLIRTNQSGQAIPTELHSEMFGEDFLYMWSYEGHNGYWYVRQRMEEPYTQIGWNRYDSNLGEILLSNVGSHSYYGELTTPQGDVWQLNGYLVEGILNMAWIDGRNNASGFAAFVIENDWDNLHGTYWKNDYEAAPFSGPWDAQAVR